MPVEDMHPEVEYMAPLWSMVADCVSGPAAVKARDYDYLPPLDWAEDGVRKYEEYKLRANFWNVARRAKIGMEGLVHRKPMDMDFGDLRIADDVLEEFLCDVTGCFESFDQHARTVFSSVLDPGRVGILVDAEPGGAHPFQRVYTGASIRNWSEEMIGRERVLTELRLDEQSREAGSGDDEFAFETVDRIRLVRLVVRDGEHYLPAEQRYMTHQLYRESDGKATRGKATRGAKYVPEGEPIVIKRRNMTIPFIPFVCMNQGRLGMSPEPPILSDLCEILLSLYRNSADLEWSMHRLPPTVVTSGVKTRRPGSNDGDTIELGGYINLSNEAAKAYIIQASSGALDGLRSLMDDKREEATLIAGRILERRKRVAEAAEAVRLQQAADASALAAMAMTTGLGLSEALAFQMWWAHGSATPGFEEVDYYRRNVNVSLASDFDALSMSADEALKWMQLELQGGISRKARLAKYEAGEVYPAGHTAEIEEEQLAAEGASLGRTTAAGGPPGSTAIEGMGG